MLRILGNLPRELGIAVSGGPDSMAILDFLNNNHDVTACYFDHGTEFGKKCKRFFHSFNMPIVTGHNLDDVIEWFLFSSIHGQGKIIPYNNKNVIRPFISTSKYSLENWCNRKEVPFLIDPGNADRKFMRSIIRHDIMPHARIVNPGVEKTFRKLVEKEYKNESTSKNL